MSTFNDVIQSYANGSSGQVETPSGDIVGYSVSSNVRTRSWGAGDKGAQVGQANGYVEVTFDSAVSNAAIFVTSANKGEEYVVSVDGQQVNLADWVAEGKATYHTQGGNQIINSDGELTSSGSWVHQHTAVLQFHVPVTRIAVAGDGSGGGWDLFDIGFAGSDLICFGPDTRIATPKGNRAIADLRVGDLVRTRDHGLQPILWIGNRLCAGPELSAFPKRRPVTLAPGALGDGLPKAPLVLSRQHRVLLRADNGDEALVPAAHLDRGATPSPTTAQRYLHLLLPVHGLILAEGVWCETLYWPGASGSLIPPEVVARLRARLPALDAMTPAAPFALRAKEAARFLPQPTPQF